MKKNFNKLKTIQKARRHHRVRMKVAGTEARPRLSVFRSLQHIYAQIIDDVKGKTLVAASDLEFEKKFKKDDASAEVGKLIAAKAAKAGITEVVFDRGDNKYHGRIKAVAEAAREGGLKF